MIIYLVIESSGSYEDYRTKILKAFKNKSDADAFVERYDELHRAKVEQEEKCRDCSFYWNHDDVKKEGFAEFIGNAKIFCALAKFCVDDECGELDCNCHQGTWDLDTYSVEINEIELE